MISHLLLIHFRWGSRATVVAGSAGQEYVDNVFYNRYERSLIHLFFEKKNDVFFILGKTTMSC